MLKIIIVHGGLGNQMFAYAFSCALKKKYPFSFTSLDMLEPWEAHNGYELLKVFPKIKGKSYKFYRRQWKLYSQFFTKYLFLTQKEKEIDYCSYNSKYVIPRGVFNIFDGFWQSEKYFKCVERKVKEQFQFDYDKLNSESKKMLLELVNQSCSVSVHIRRGDYKDYQDYFGGICTTEYYQNAINYLKSQIHNPKFYFFSDDIEWVKYEFKDLNAVFVDWNLKEESWQDLFLMSQCNHNIIANSSFSWWGAWLNNNSNKIVIAPQKWFNKIPARDIIPETWIKR